MLNTSIGAPPLRVGEIQGDQLAGVATSVEMGDEWVLYRGIMGGRMTEWMTQCLCDEMAGWVADCGFGEMAE